MISGLRLSPALTVTGKETICVSVDSGGQTYSASVPLGTSTGKREAKQLSPKEVSRVFGQLRPRLEGMEADYERMDSAVQRFDGTHDFSKAGANLALSISLATARAQTAGSLYKAFTNARPSFPMPVVNAIGGGRHGGSTDWQEFLLIPGKAKTPLEAYMQAYDAYSEASERLKRAGKLTGMNREHAMTSRLNDEETLDLLADIAGSMGLKLGVDCAASSFFGKGYMYKDRKRSAGEQMDYVAEMAKRFNIFYIEDPLDEDDFESFAELTRKLPGRLVVGDDLYCTNPELLAKGIKWKSSTGIIIKPDQIGNLSKTAEVVRMAKASSLEIILSHRSNETPDSWLADLAVGFGARYIKIGIGYDVPKHNRLIEILMGTG